MSNNNLRGFIKYPKTLHIQEFADKQGSLASLVQKSQTLVIEEKMDGTQVGISLDSGSPQIQSRGSFIGSESEFSRLKQWLHQHADKLYSLLQERYILFGEWLYLKHTMYYDCLPDYFMEFDIYDRKQNVFLSTQRRKELLSNLDFVHSVKVLAMQQTPSLKTLKPLITQSSFTSTHAFDHFDNGILAETDTTGLMEGLYLKVEDDNSVVARYKLIRPEFIKTIIQSGSHWKRRQAITNQVNQSLNSALISTTTTN